MLVNSLYSTGVRPKANVIMSFNNKPASEAVPYFDQVRTRFSVEGGFLVTPSLIFGGIHEDFKKSKKGISRWPRVYCGHYLFYG
jgi:hypothetical protein